MSWSWHAYNPVTGDRLADLDPVSGATWAEQLNVVSTGSATFQLGGSADAPDYEALFSTDGWDRAVVVCWAGKPVAAGLVTSTDRDFDANTYTVGYHSYRVIFSRRTTFGTNGYSGHTNDAVYSLKNRSLRAIANGLAWAAEQGPAAGYSLRLSYGPDSEAGNANREYYDYQGLTIEEALQEIEETDGGPDIELRPVLSGSDKLSWEYRTGNPKLPGGTVDFSLGQEHSLTGVKQSRDLLKLTNRVYVLGSGTEQDRRWSEASSAARPIGLDMIEPMTDKDDVAVLRARARSVLASNQRPVETWSMSLIASGTPGLDQVSLGTILRVMLPGATAWNSFRVMGMSGSSGSDLVSLTVEVI